jgi:hypothetical protein
MFWLQESVLITVILGGVPGSKPFPHENYLSEEGVSPEKPKGILGQEKQICT